MILADARDVIEAIGDLWLLGLMVAIRPFSVLKH